MKAGIRVGRNKDVKRQDRRERKEMKKEMEGSKREKDRGGIE